MNHARIAIVGGGISGLLTAMHLCEAGVRPVLFEATSHPGGRAQTRDIMGFRLNQGPHALYVDGSFYAALRRFGVEPAGNGPDLTRGLSRWEGATFPFPLGSGGRYPEPIDEQAAQSLGRFYGLLLSKPGFGKGQSLAETLSDMPCVARTVIEALVRLSTYVNAPADLDALAALDQLRLSFRGTIYVDGGWQRLVDGLCRAARAAGAEIRTKERVRRVRSEGEICKLDLKSGSSEAFDAVVLATPPSNAAALVPQSAVLASHSARARPVRVSSIDLALSDLPRPEVNFALGMNEPLYMSVHSAVSQLAPPGGAIVHLARYLAPDERAAREHFDRLEQFADELQPGWRDRVLHAQRLSGAVVANDFPRSGPQGERADTKIEDASWVFVAGDWVGPEGMLADASAASALCAARAALGRSPLLAKPSIEIPSRFDPAAADRQSAIAI